MAARDLFHTIVRSALEINGWTITHDPFVLTVGGVDFAIDLGAEQLIAANCNVYKLQSKLKAFLAHHLLPISMQP